MSDNKGSYYTFLRNQSLKDVTSDNYLTYQQENAKMNSLNTRKNVTFMDKIKRRENIYTIQHLHFWNSKDFLCIKNN